MEHPAQRVPAWKRLGLKLKHDQSGADSQVVEHQVAGHQPDNSHIARPDKLDLDPHTLAPVDASYSGLGKRKHPAEIDQNVRKSRRTQSQENDYRDVIQSAPIVTELDNEVTETSTSTAASSEKPRPKGDPNYRKKKGRKGNQYDERKSAHVQVALPPQSPGGQPVHKHPRTPSLSPSQLDLASDGATLVVSTETDFTESSAIAKKGSSKSASSSVSPRIDRRKSVTFTPDTKTVDGNSASNLFKKWAQEQKGSGTEFSQSEVAQFTPPPKSHPANGVPGPSTKSNGKDKKSTKAEKKAKKLAIDPQHKTSALVRDITLFEQSKDSIPNDEQVTDAAVSTGKKKDTSRYTTYLEQYYNDRPHWKFNKAKQNDVLENALNIFRIPSSHLEALIAYVKGLQGVGVIERLKQRCIAAIKEIDVELSTMDNAEVRKAAEEEALQEHLSRERKRRRLEGDIENMLGHPHSEGYILRLKRGRAQALLTALNLAAPAPAPSKPHLNGLCRKFSPEPALPPQRNTREQKRKASVSSDESSDSSSSEESSSSSESDDESEYGSDSESTSSGSSDGDDTTRAVRSRGTKEGSDSSGSESEKGSEESTSDSESDSE
jgi:hypothetical protein